MTEKLAVDLNKQDQVMELARAFRDGVGSSLLSDRKHHLTVYKSCFIGHDAVEWLLTHTSASTREEASQLGQRLFDLGLFSHVAFKHGFEDGGLFYRFNDEESSGGGGDHLPPGSFGLPGLGETRDLQNDVLGFLDNRSNIYQGFFKTNVIFHKSVFFTSPESVGHFFDQKCIHRAGGMPPHWQALFGKGTGNVVNMLDGEEHLKRKAIIMSCFTEEALESYLPAMDAVIKKHLDQWAAEGTVCLRDKTRDLCFEECFRVVLGTDPSAKFSKWLGQLLAGFAALPVSLPGTTLNKALKARDSILAFVKDIIAARRQGSSSGSPNQDMLGRFIAAAGDLPDDVIAMEVQHFMLAGMSPTYTLHVYLGLELARCAPDVWQRMRDEVLSLPSVSQAELQKMIFMRQVISEIKRLYAGHAVPFQFAKVVQPLTYKNMTVPEGWTAVAGYHSVCRSPVAYSNPNSFDPDRFAPHREEHRRYEFAFVPQGVTPDVARSHGCAGFEFSTILLQLFLISILRGGFKWELVPNQKLQYDTASTPVLSRDGVKVKFWKAQD